MIRCLAIDDEKLALDLLEDNIGKVPFLSLARTCKNAVEALETLRAEKIDLIFLDIQMPDISGIQMLKSLKKKPLVIFTTAYSDYAMEGFELDVMDYLLKPYTFERFLKAVNKAREYLDLSENTPGPEQTPTPSFSDYLFVRSDYKLVKIDLSGILYIESLGDYVKIFTGEKPILTQMSMKALEEKLPASAFIRVHRSFIVAFSKIDYIQKQQLGIGNREIPISDHYRDQLFMRINQPKTDENNG